jgi:hypothetical protein
VAYNSNVVLEAEVRIAAINEAKEAASTAKATTAAATLCSDSLAVTKKLRAADGHLTSLSNPELKVLVQGVFAARKERGSSKYTSKAQMIEYLTAVENLVELVDSLETTPAPTPLTTPNAPLLVAPAVHTAPQTASHRRPLAPVVTTLTPSQPTLNSAPVVTQTPSQPTPNPVDFSTMDIDAFEAHMAVAMAEAARRRAATSR